MKLIAFFVFLLSVTVCCAGNDDEKIDFSFEKGKASDFFKALKKFAIKEDLSLFLDDEVKDVLNPDNNALDLKVGPIRLHDVTLEKFVVLCSNFTPWEFKVLGGERIVVSVTSAPVGFEVYVSKDTISKIGGTKNSVEKFLKGKGVDMTKIEKITVEKARIGHKIEMVIIEDEVFVVAAIFELLKRELRD